MVLVWSFPCPQQEAESNLRKAKQGYVQRCEDHDKARFLVAKAEEEQVGAGPGAGGVASKTLDKRRRLEEEAKNKVRAGHGAGPMVSGPDLCRIAPRWAFVWAVPPARNAFLSFCAWLISMWGLKMP